jgi:hypothetical protein
MKSKVFWQRFWLDLCTEQVISARACANQFLPYNSLGVKLIGMRSVQEDSCYKFEPTDTLFISVGGQEGRGVWGVDGHIGPEAKIDT